MTCKKNKKIITAVMGGGANGYDAVSLLNAHNIETYLLSPHQLTDGRYPGAELLRCPSPDENDTLAEFINETVSPGNSVVLLPTADAFAFFLARNRNRLDKRFLYLMPDVSLVEATDNKMLFYELCLKHGIPCPATYVVRTKYDFESVRNSFTFPCVIKPFRSRDWPESVGYKVTTVNSVEELRTVVSGALSFKCEVIIQDMIPGGAITDFVVGGLYDPNSKPLKLYVGQKILQNPLDVGAGCYMNLVWNQYVIDLCNTFVKRTGYFGLVDVDVKYDRRNQTYKIIEVNPRNGMCHKISSNGRWDLLSFYVHWINGMEDVAKDYHIHQDGRKWIYPHRHLCSRIEEKGLVGGIGQWLKDMHQTKLRCAWDIRDIHRTWRYLRIVAGHIRQLKIRTLIFGRQNKAY